MLNTERPSWLKKRLLPDENVSITKEILKIASTTTVCESSLCPNLSECFSRRFATFMILGRRCTRSCGFCSIGRGAPDMVDPAEPENIVKAVKKLNLDYVVITSVTRDDLEDGGAGQFRDVILRIKEHRMDIAIEALIPDFKGDGSNIRKIIDAAPDVMGHNIETVKRLYAAVKPSSEYSRSLSVLRMAKELAPSILTKSGIMLGLGERGDEVMDSMDDLRSAGCDMLTIGQYLRPGAGNLPVRRFAAPDEFALYKSIGIRMGFRHVAAGPFVRSSYLAEDAYDLAITGIGKEEDDDDGCSTAAVGGGS